MDFILLFFFIVIIIPSAIIHEYAHGWMADRLGDPTARHAGRLTLNPLAHIDMFGTIILPLFLFLSSWAAVQSGFLGGTFLFAYAKPVPYNPFNLKNFRWDPVKVALAGPASNIIIALLFGSLIRFAVLPITMVDLAAVIVYANILLAVFNMVPIPPLDGSKLLYALLPNTREWMQFKATFERYGFMILLFFIFFAFEFLVPLMQWLFVIFTGARFY
ncbi:MAG: site-2 protease family protein [Patescibacteria group bacterium]